MQGICIDPGNAELLQKDQKYFLFEHGPSNYYVSRFDNEKAHFGSFERKRFKLVEDPHPEPFEHPGELMDDGRVVYYFENPDKEPYIEPAKDPVIKLKRFVAKVSKRRLGYRIDDLFIITEKGPNGYFHVYLKDRPAGAPVGSYVTNFFETIIPYDEVEITDVTKRAERPKLQAIDNPAPKPLANEVKQENKPEQKPKPTKKKKEVINIVIKAKPKPKPKPPKPPKQAKKKKGALPDGQMNIFDFLEG